MNSISHIQKSDPPEIIFIVDDNTANLSVLSQFLDEVGFSVRVAKDGNSALRKIAYEQPSLILLDIMMPGMDGFETCQHLKASAKTKEIPIIFMTALSDTVDKVKGLSMGAVDYITKPFQQDEVLARIRLQLKLRALSREIEQQNISLQKEVEQRRAAEAALQDTIQKLKTTQQQMIAQEKLASLGSLTAGIAHELRNPLNFAINYAESSRELLDELQGIVTIFADKLEAEAVEEVSELILDLQENSIAIHQHGMRAEKIISSMMQHARADGVNPQITCLNALVSEAVEFTYHSLRAKEHGFNVTVREDYDDAIGELKVIPSALSRALINLLDNAFYTVLERDQEDVTDNNGNFYEPQVWVQTARIKDGVEIRIRDNGKGVPPELRNQIFQPFVTTKPTGQGTGLGLSMSHDIVVGQHGGSLSLTADSPLWTEFIITLPNVSSISGNMGSTQSLTS